MSQTTLRLPARTTPSRRTAVLAGASAIVIAASISVTLAVSGGGSDTSAKPSPAAATAAQDRVDGQSAAERFHHFR
jgi:hypothetical protein